jgi:hypothetical protein
MADIKISQLPAATTPLAGTEEVPLVQSGTTKKVSVANLRGAPVTAVTGTAPVVSSGGTAPVISMAAANTSTNGYLTSTDWNTFNNKGSGSVTGVTATSPVVSSGGTAPVISLPAATTSANGYLTSTDWNTFNNKQPAGSYLTSGGALGTPSSGTATNLTGLPLTTGVTGTLPVANGGTGVTSSTGTGSTVLSTSPTLVTPVLGTPASATLTNATGLPLTTGVTGLLPVANGGSGTATPSLVAGTNVSITGTWPNQTINSSGGGGGGMVYPGAGIPLSTGAAWGTSYGTTGTGDVVLSTSPTLVTPALGTPSSVTLTNATGLPVSTGISGLGTGVATALAVNVGSAGAPVVNGGALGTPSSGTVTNLTGTASININGTVGATTASTGAFTTLSATGVTTVQAGTVSAPAITTSGDTNTGIFFPAADTIAFAEGGVESMRLDSNGSVGIGVTPANATLDVLGSANTVGLAIRGRSSDNLGSTVFKSNNSATEYAYFQSGPTYLATGVNGAERMRIDSSGNVGIGTSSPGARLEISSTGASGRILLNGADLPMITNGFDKFTSGAYSGAGRWGMFMEFGQLTMGCASNGSFTFKHFNADSTSTERARIDSSGNLLVGTTTATGKITSNSGGSTSAASFVSSGSNLGVQVTDTGASGANILLVGDGATTPNKSIRAQQGNFQIINSAYSAIVISATDGGAANQGNNSASWTVVSDARIKTNVRQIGGALDKIAALKPCHFEYKNAIGETSTGFIAQEFEEVFPGHVKEQDAPMQFEQFIDGENKKIKTVDANLVPYLVKAIQELKAEFDAYKATHP